jgi:hypothetical protein
MTNYAVLRLRTVNWKALNSTRQGLFRFTVILFCSGKTGDQRVAQSVSGNTANNSCTYLVQYTAAHSEHMWLSTPVLSLSYVAQYTSAGSILCGSVHQY